MDDRAFPALFRAADEAAQRRQKDYLRLIKTEYSLIFISAILSTIPTKNAFFFVGCAAIFFLSIIVLLVRSLGKPEQDWYRARALAESAKTIGWRYVMRAAPFGGGAEFKSPRQEFGEHLRQLIDANRSTVEKLSPIASAEDQITAEMVQARALTIEERKTLYLTHRVRDQRLWYSTKASFNRTAAARWVVVTSVAYGLAGLLSLARILLPTWQVWPIEPLIVFASSAIGWMQIKKFNELAAAYTVTAHEIGLIGPKFEGVTAEEGLSDLINEAELAFSREHTYWIARQTS